MKPNADSGGKPNGIPGLGRTRLERSDASISIVQEVFRFVNRNLSGAERGKDAGRPADEAWRAIRFVSQEKSMRRILLYDLSVIGAARNPPTPNSCSTSAP